MLHHCGSEGHARYARAPCTSPVHGAASARFLDRGRWIWEIRPAAGERSQGQRELNFPLAFSGDNTPHLEAELLLDAFTDKPVPARVFSRRSQEYIRKSKL